MEKHDTPAYRQFTTKSEADKALNSLRGILIGINLDGQVNDAELLELGNWCSKHQELVDRNPFKDFMLLISEVINEHADREELIEDLLWRCKQYESENIFYNQATADLQTLQGICHGILADGLINDEEVKSLDKWLEDNEHLASYYPYDELRSLIISVLSDGKIDAQERLRLMAYFNEFVNLTDAELSSKIKLETADVTISGICTVDPNVIFVGKTFCFTGLSKKAKRSEIAQQIISLGGFFSNTITKTTDYLIVGDDGNPCWAFACYGRKVEVAVGLRKQGNQISLIHEYDFWDFVEDGKPLSNLSA
jgi:hypothetical protein